MLEKINGWQMWTSDAQFTLVKQTLTEFVQEFQSELLALESNYHQSAARLKQMHEQKLAAAKHMLMDDPIAKAKNERDTLVKDAQERWSGPKGALTYHYKREPLTTIVYRVGDGFLDSRKIKKAKQKNSALEDHFQKEQERLRTQERAIESLLQRFRGIADSVLAAKTDYQSKVYNDTARRENAEYERSMELLKNKFDNQRDETINRYQQEFKKYFSKEALQTAVGSAQSLMRSGSGYVGRSDIPQAMYFGNRTFSIPSGNGMFEAGVIGMFLPSENQFFKMNADNTLVYVTLPYCRTIQEGYSVFLLCNNPQAEKTNGMIRAYTMKILMNFPAGQIRPLLLDSESTTTFSMFTDIGDATGRGIVTRPWNKEADIENELQKVTAEHHQLVTSYGEDLEARLQREPIYYVACRNFPKGISEKALHEMDVIWLAGSSSGFFGMVTANPDDFKNIKNPDPINHMQSHSLVLTEDEYGFFIGTKKANADRLTFDMLPDVMRNPQDVLRVITSGFNKYRRQIEKFEYLFSKDSGNVELIDANDINTWMRGDASHRCELPIGIFGARTVQKLTIEGTKQHALISGVTGSGKSSLLRTLVIAAMIKYDPNNVNFYLIDFKEGVEFAPLAKYNLPWIKMIALNTEREFARSILRELEREFKRRAEAMSQSNISNIGRETAESFPRIFLVFDEIQELLRINDEISEDCINILATLVSEGRAMNINVILASQNFNVCNGMDRLKANMVIRIAFGGNSESAKCIMGDDFSASQIEQGDSGFAAINTAGGASNQTSYFQVGYLAEVERDEILKKLVMIFSNRGGTTRILSRKASMDINNRFNRLILGQDFELSEQPHNYDLMIGEFSSMKRKFITIAPKAGDNILIVGNTETNAKSICSLAILSFLYDELAANAAILDNELVRIIDLSDTDSEHYDYFSTMRSMFNRQISYADLENMEMMISDTYDNMLRRQRGELDASERMFLILFGIDGSIDLQQEMYADSSEDGVLSPAQKITKILENGPQVGINSIIWVRSLPALKRIVENRVINATMNKRIFYGKNLDNACEELTGVAPESVVQNGSMAQYKNRHEVSTSVIRLYDLPEEDWIRRFSQVYDKIIKERNGN